MKTVGTSETATERELGLGRLRCPSCAGALRRWGWARSRVIRTLGGTMTARPRRTRCTACGRTHVLLPELMLLRRADTVDVLGAALTAHSRGMGYRRIARLLARPSTTVRDWLRRWTRRPPAFHPGRVWGWRDAARATEGGLLSPPPEDVATRVRSSGPPHPGSAPVER